MKDKIELDLQSDELVVEGSKLILKTTLYMDHICSSGDEGGGLEIPVNLELAKQLKSSFGIDPTFSPYERVELNNTLDALERLNGNCTDLIKDLEAEIRLMDTDTEYIDEDEDE